MNWPSITHTKQGSAMPLSRKLIVVVDDPLLSILSSASAVKTPISRLGGHTMAISFKRLQLYSPDMIYMKNIAMLLLRSQGQAEDCQEFLSKV